MLCGAGDSRCSWRLPDASRRSASCLGVKIQSGKDVTIEQASVLGDRCRTKSVRCPSHWVACEFRVISPAFGSTNGDSNIAPVRVEPALSIYLSLELFLRFRHLAPPGASQNTQRKAYRGGRVGVRHRPATFTSPRVPTGCSTLGVLVGPCPDGQRDPWQGPADEPESPPGPEQMPPTTAGIEFVRPMPMTARAHPGRARHPLPAGHRRLQGTEAHGPHGRAAHHLRRHVGPLGGPAIVRGIAVGCSGGCGRGRWVNLRVVDGP